MAHHNEGLAIRRQSLMELSVVMLEICNFTIEDVKLGPVLVDEGSVVVNFMIIIVDFDIIVTDVMANIFHSVLQGSD